MSSLNDLCVETLKGGRTMECEQGGLVIHLGVDGIISVQILATESDAEAELQKLWNALRPAIEAVFVGVRS